MERERIYVATSLPLDVLLCAQPMLSSSDWSAWQRASVGIQGADVSAVLLPGTLTTRRAHIWPRAAYAVHLVVAVAPA